MRMSDVEWESPLLDPVKNAAAERFLRREIGTVPSGACYFLDSPWLTSALAAFDLRALPLMHVSRTLMGLLALVVSQDNSCRYCYAETRGLMRILGFSEQRIEQLEENLQTADLSRRDKLGLEFARRVSRADPPATRSDAQALIDEGYSLDEVKELVVLAAVTVFFNRVATLPALPPEPAERLPQLWYFRLLRPAMALMLSRATVPARRQSLTPQQRCGPFAPFVNVLDPLPVAARLRRVIDDALQETALTRRAKTLAFAVVARSLGCATSQAEVMDMLAAEGLDAEHSQRILRDLASPQLDAIENAILPFARDTVWYRPVQVQRRAREIRGRLDREQFVELIGTSALANAVCRLGTLLEVARPLESATIREPATSAESATSAEPPTSRPAC